jgi:hypothetical protein
MSSLYRSHGHSLETCPERTIRRQMFASCFYRWRKATGTIPAAHEAGGDQRGLRSGRVQRYPCPQGIGTSRGGAMSRVPRKLPKPLPRSCYPLREGRCQAASYAHGCFPHALAIIALEKPSWEIRCRETFLNL